MHPFCCVSTLSDQSPMPSASSTLALRSANHNQIYCHVSGDNGNKLNHSHNHNHNNSIINTSTNKRVVASMAAAAAAASVAATSFREDVKINDIVGNGISGILYKWVNYGKGWRPRWFVLQDGVLSYYKIHGPDKIVVNQETEKGCKVIGDESMRRIAANSSSTSINNNNANSNNRDNNNYNHKNSSTNLSLLRPRKPFGEIHLKVSSIRESRSDDKRFSIFTGTKRLHLRAETREDRIAWVEALLAVKDMFPRMSNSELMAPLGNVTVSTEKLRQRLEQEGVREAAILDSEQIMRSEFAALQNQLILLKQKQWLLIDTLRQLEVHVMKSRKLLPRRIRKSTSCSSGASARGSATTVSLALQNCANSK